MARRAVAAAAGPRGSSSRASAAATAVTAASARVPTWQQRAAVAVYVYFMPVFLVLNMAMLLSRSTAIPWLL